MLANISADGRDDTQSDAEASLGGNYVQSKTLATVHRPEQVIRLPPSAESNDGRVLLRQKRVSDWLGAEKSFA